MAVECENKGNAIVLAGIGNSLPDDLLVAKMHAIKKPNRKADFAVARLQFIGGMDDFHD
jgi:cell shape-determining protein MreC